jgi:hypothetical protein
VEHYERQTEDEAADRRSGQIVMVAPNSVAPQITRLIEGRRSREKAGCGQNATLRSTAITTTIRAGEGTRSMWVLHQAPTFERELPYHGEV